MSLDIYAIEASRKDSRKEMIDENRAEMKKGFFHRLFKRPDPTDEEVETYIAGDRWFSPLWLCDNAHYEGEAVAKRLLNACKYVEEFYVSTEDLERLW